MPTTEINPAQALAELLGEVSNDSNPPTRELIESLITGLDAIVQLNLSHRFAQGSMSQKQFNSALLKTRAMIALGHEIIDE